MRFLEFDLLDAFHLVRVRGSSTSWTKRQMQEPFTETQLEVLEDVQQLVDSDGPSMNLARSIFKACLHGPDSGTSALEKNTTVMKETLDADHTTVEEFAQIMYKMDPMMKELCLACVPIQDDGVLQIYNRSYRFQEGDQEMVRNALADLVVVAFADNYLRTLVGQATMGS